MPQVRVLLACPRMTKASVWRAILATDPEVELVGEASDPVEALLEAGSQQATVVVIDLPPSGGEPGLSSHLLEEYPQLKVLAVSRDGNRIVKYENGILRSTLPSASPGQLSGLLRSLWAAEPDPIASDRSQ